MAVDPQWLEDAQDDATLLAIRDQEQAGIDIITDGEIRRESYSNRFATALDGTGSGQSRDRPLAAAGIPFRFRALSAGFSASIPCRCGMLQFLRANTARKIKVTVPGPFTMANRRQ